MTPRRLAARVYVRCAAPFGRRALERMLDDGLPHRLAAPLRFLFDGHAPPQARELAARIERVREEIAARTGAYTLPPTSSSHPPVPSWAWLANNVSVQCRWGLFLYLCAEAFGARTIVELGSCVGISGAYLAAAPSAPRVVTIEASPELAPVAKETIARFSTSSAVLHGMFDDRLPDALQAPVGMAYIDGHHDGAATLRYVRTIAPHLEPGALVVLDDIRLYDEMDEAWKTLRAMPGIAAAVDVGRFGLLVFGEGEGTLYDLARYTGWWKVGGKRRRASGQKSDRTGKE
jgi:predicted O-methyltransferase YrrM